MGSPMPSSNRPGSASAMPTIPGRSATNGRASDAESFARTRAVRSGPCGAPRAMLAFRHTLTAESSSWGSMPRTFTGGSYSRLPSPSPGEFPAAGGAPHLCLARWRHGGGAERTDEFDSWWQTLTDPEQRKVVASVEAFSDLSDEVRKRPGAAEEIDARKRAIIAAVRLNELRKQCGQTQAQLADLLGMTQANVSRIERSDNLYLSTLADYVDALGGHIEINAVFDDDVVSLGPVEKDRSELST